MIRWLLIAFIIYLIYKLITGPGRKRNRQKPFFTFQFGQFPNGSQQDRGKTRGKEKTPDLDEIEEAEYEEIKEEKESKN